MSVSPNATDAMVAQWRLALADTAVGEDQVHLIALPGLPGPRTGKAVTYVDDVVIEETGPQAILSADALSEANCAAHIGKTRVAIFAGYPEEHPVDLAILAGKVRHELRHVEQRLSPVWAELQELEWLTVEVSDCKAGDLTGGAVFYTQIPTELDANAAAARFLRLRHPDAVDALLETDEAALARSATPPEAIEDLPAKCVAYLFVFREIAESWNSAMASATKAG